VLPFSPAVMNALYIASSHPRLSVRGEEPQPMGHDPVCADPVCAEHSGPKGVNLEKQSPILRYERHAYEMNGSG
jgi:hypothetical protein